MGQRILFKLIYSHREVWRILATVNVCVRELALFMNLALSRCKASNFAKITDYSKRAATKCAADVFWGAVKIKSKFSRLINIIFSKFRYA